MTMASQKKSLKSKFITEELNDFLNASQFLNDSPKNKKQPNKRQRVEAIEKDSTNIIAVDPTATKKKKVSGGNFELCGETRQKILHVMNHQLETRKQINDNLLKNFLEVITQMEADYSAVRDNEQKLEHLTGSFMKCIQQSTAAHKQKLKAFKEIHTSFKNQMEGLLFRGATKPDDRPLWFDVYKAFPPITEPKFARPKPESKPIRQILYKEDLIRVKFHLKGHGLNSNMLSHSGETHTKRLIQKYNELQSNGVPEDEIIEKTLASVDSERQIVMDNSKTTSPKPAPTTAQPLPEVDIKNIFKE